MTQELMNFLGAFGGWAAVVAVLLHYLADLNAKRALQNEASLLSRRLADLSHELKLRESAYAKHLELLVRYYEAFYRHYRLCQNATNQDGLKLPDGTVVRTKEVFWQNLEQYRTEMAALEGSARLLLPGSLLELHEESVSAFNQFKDVMKSERYDDKFHTEKREAFARILDVKTKLESGLRKFMRTEHMLSPSEA
jgi:hypothetical protein